MFICGWSHIRCSLPKHSATFAVVNPINSSSITFLINHSKHNLARKTATSALTVLVFEIVVLVVDHVLLVKALADLAVFVFTLPIAVPSTISHFF